MSEDADYKTQILRRPPAVIKARPALLNCVDTSVLKDGVGARIALGGENGDNVITVGRDDENLVSLHAQGVSRYHARMYQDSGSWMVEDLGSTNGTRINNSKLDGKQPLNNGDTVAFGRACYKFQLLDENAAGSTTGIDIDLGASDKTVMIRPSQRASSAAIAAKPAPASTSAANSTGAAKAPAPKSAGSSNALLWVIVVVAFIVLIGGGAKLLGFF